MNIDLLRTSTSRFEVFKLTTEALQHHLKFSGSFKWYVHEDVMNADRSKKLLEYAKGIYQVISNDSPPIGQGASVKWLLDNSSTKYILFVEDDWRLIKDLNVDLMVKIMEENKDVNQICANKRHHLAKKGDFVKREVIKSGITLTTNPYWTFVPGLWRSSFIKDHLPDDFVKKSGGECSYGVCNKLRFDFPSNDYGPEWVINKVGTYYLGPIKKQHKKDVEDGKITPEEYNNMDDGFYFQHMGYIPYEPEKWIWPIPLPPRVKGLQIGKERPYINDRLYKWKYNDVKWNPTMPVSDNPEYEKWHKPKE